MINFLKNDVFFHSQKGDANEAIAAIETAKMDILKADEAVDFFNKVLDQTVPWHTFSDSLFEMDKYRSDYSVETAALILEIKRLVLDSMDKYFMATRNIYGWCNVASHLLTAYVNLFQNINREKSAAQKAILLEVLNTGIDKMMNVQYDLNIISTDFTEASTKLSMLQVRFDNEFHETDDWYRLKIRQLQEKVNNGSSSIGPFGVFVGADTRELSTRLDEKLASSKQFYSQLKRNINIAFIDIEEARIKLNDEIRIFGKLKMQTEETKPFESFDDATLRDTVIRFAESLSNKCNEYRKRHN